MKARDRDRQRDREREREREIQSVCFVDILAAIVGCRKQRYRSVLILQAINYFSIYSVLPYNSVVPTSEYRCYVNFLRARQKC